MPLGQPCRVSSTQKSVKRIRVRTEISQKNAQAQGNIQRRPFCNPLRGNSKQGHVLSKTTARPQGQQMLAALRVQ
jgi:hypothetical protein